MRRFGFLAALSLGLFLVVAPTAYGTIYSAVYIESDEESLTGITSIVITLNDLGSAGRPFWKADGPYMTTEVDPAGTAADVGIPDLTGAAGADWVRDGPWADGKISYSGTDPLTPGILDGYDMSDDDLVVTDVEVIGWVGTVTFSVSDFFLGWGAYNAKSLTITLSTVIADTTAPVIELAGDADVSVNLDGTYTEEGATATDDVDGDVAVTIGGDTVDTTTAGIYTVTYDASDAAGNDATRVTRTVTVAEAGAPVIELIGDASVDVELNGTYTEEGATATDEVDGDVAVTIGGDTVDTTTVGVYTVTYDASDAAGNNATQVTRTVTVAEAYVDTTGPIITLTGDASVAVELDGTYTEEGATATDDLDVDVAVTIGGDTVDTTTAGVYAVTYDASDVAGNDATQVTRTVTVADTTAPVIELEGWPDVTVLLNATYTEDGATATDAVDGDVAVTIGGDTVDPTTVGIYIVTYDASDDAGNAATQVEREVTVPPAIQASAKEEHNSSCFINALSWN